MPEKEIRKVDKVMRPEAGSVTVSNPLRAAFEGWIGSYNPSTIAQSTFEKMEADPDIALALAIRKAPIFGIDYWIECADPDIRAFVTHAYGKIHRELVKSSLRALHRGFIPHEKVWQNIPRLVVEKEDDATGQRVEVVFENALIYEKIKANHPESVRIIKKDDRFAGYTQGMIGAGVTVEPEKAFIMTWDEEFGNKFGRSILTNAYSDWYMDKKLLVDMMIHMERRASPPMKARHPRSGETDDNGNFVDYATIALELGISAQSNSVITLPSTRDPQTNLYEWDIEYIKDESKGAVQYWMVHTSVFVPAKFRAIFIPEMVAIKSGSAPGTHAQSKTARHTLIEIQEDMLEWFLQAVNDYILPDLVKFNFGSNAPRAYIKTKGFSDNTKEIWAELMKGLAANTDFTQEIAFREMLEGLGVPVIQDEHGTRIAEDKKKDTEKAPAPEDAAIEFSAHTAHSQHSHVCLRRVAGEPFKAWRKPFPREEKVNFKKIDAEIEKSIIQGFIGGIKDLTKLQEEQVALQVRRIWRDNLTKAARLRAIEDLTVKFTGKYENYIRGELMRIARFGLDEVVDELSLKGVEAKMTPAVRASVRATSRSITAGHTAEIERRMIEDLNNAAIGEVSENQAVFGLTKTFDKFRDGTGKGIASATLVNQGSSAVMNAFNRGRESIIDLVGKENFVGAQFSNFMDTNVCPFCLEMGGGYGAMPKVIGIDDPDFSAMMPLFHDGCRCQRILIHRDQVDADLIKPDYTRPSGAMLKQYAPQVPL